MNIVKLKDAGGNGIYPVGHSDAIKVYNEQKTLTTKLGEIEANTSISVSSSTGVIIGDANDVDNPALVINTDSNSNQVYLKFTKGSNTYSIAIPSIKIENNVLKYSTDGNTWNDGVRLSNLTIKEVFNSPNVPPTSVSDQADSYVPYSVGDLVLVENTTTTPSTFDLKVCSSASSVSNSVNSSNNDWTYVWDSIGNINNVTLDAEHIDYSPEDTEFDVSNVKDALDALRTTDGITMAGENKTLTEKLREVPDIVNSGDNSDLDITDNEGNVLARFTDGHFQTKNFDSSKIESSINNGVSVKSDDSIADFNIGDDNGKVIVQFKNGHIKTQNFDSREIGGVELFTQKFKGKKIAIIGDSISTFSGWLPSDISGYDGATYATYYPRGNVSSATNTWWYKMCIALGINPNTEFNNCAWSGSRICGDSTSENSAYVACSNKRIFDLGIRGFTPDIVLCYIGCNDWGNSPYIPVGNWNVNDPIPSEGNISTLREGLALMLYKLHASYPLARIFVCTILDDTLRDQASGYPSNNPNGVTVNDYNKAITEVAMALGCDVINLHECGINYANIANFVVDGGLHPNDAGHTLIARKIVSELFAKY